MAIAYHLLKTPYVFPIIGGRKVEQLRENLQALDISLTPEQINRIESTKPFEPDFSYSVFVNFICFFALRSPLTGCIDEQLG